MYLPSPLTGTLADRYGGHRISAVGAALLTVARLLTVVTNPGIGSTVIVLLLLGAGRNTGEGAPRAGGTALPCNDSPGRVVYWACRCWLRLGAGRGCAARKPMGFR